MEVSGQLHAPASLSCRKEASEPIEWEPGWVPEKVWTLRKREEPLPLAGIELRLPGRPVRGLVTILNELPRLQAAPLINIIYTIYKCS
jgi:hypothetical protein